MLVLCDTPCVIVSDFNALFLKAQRVIVFRCQCAREKCNCSLRVQLEPKSTQLQVICAAAHWLISFHCAVHMHMRVWQPGLLSQVDGTMELVD